jgi:Lrp/AsnC family transcriptional regulator, leucine-responsive regulatory protein
MKKKDLMIVSMLRKNARESLTNMSKRTKVPISTIYERLKSCNKGIITKFTSLIDFSQLGYATRANIMIKVHKNSKNALKEYLLKHQQTNSLYKINNGFDFLVEGVFQHLQELEDFLECIEDKFEIQNKQVHYIIDDIKRESFMAEPSSIDIFL